MSVLTTAPLTPSADEVTDLDDFASAIGRTPLAAVRVSIGGARRTILLKLEGMNPCGSIKDRTAWGLLRSLGDDVSRLKDVVLVESTSGNLGVALAFVARLAGLRFVAVVDPKLSPTLLEELVALGAELERVEEPDEHGSFLHARLERVRRLRDEIPGAIWLDQYGNRANPGVHAATTGPEILRQTCGWVDSVFAAVSTGGTLAGIGRCFRRRGHGARIVGVDAVGSVVFGTPAGPRRLTGIGSSRHSQFLDPSLYDDFVLVRDEEAFAFCRELHARTGIAVGGSSGAVLAACVRYLAAHPELRQPVCVAADDGRRYERTIYDDAWLEAQGVEPVERPPRVGGRLVEIHDEVEVREWT